MAAILRGILAGLEPAYAAVVLAKNRKFDTGRAQPKRVSAPVISVGNLTVGGTGKTPLVCWLAEWFQARGTAVTLISRGYKSQRGRPNDEALELAARLPQVPHLQNPDRVAAAEQAIQQNSRQILILDDAFQHRRIARDLDIVLLDALAPFGYGRLLPRGLLREPVSSLARAHVIGLSRSDAVDAAERQRIKAEALKHSPRALWIELVHKPVALVSNTGEQTDLSALHGVRVAAFCGIGNPEGFRHTLAFCGLDVAALREFPDHCAYTEAELDRLEQWLYDQAPISAVVCTRKDLVKIPREWLAGLPLWALEIGLEITVGQAELEQRLEGLLPH